MTFIIKPGKPHRKPNPARISERTYNADAARFLEKARQRKAQEAEITEMERSFHETDEIEQAFERAINL